MVSKASDDLPDPLTPVMTISDRGGSVTSTFLRLWVRAPRTTIWPRVSVLAIFAIYGVAIWGVAMEVENSGGTGTVHGSAAVPVVQPRQGQTVLFCMAAVPLGRGHSRGSCVSPPVHRQSALYGDGGRLAGASVERRRARVHRPSRRPRNGPSARLRLRGLRGSCGCRGGD